MWAATVMTTTEEVVAGVGHWAQDGLDGKYQPDNYAGRGENSNKDEECVAAAVNARAAFGADAPDKYVPSVRKELHIIPCTVHTMNLLMILVQSGSSALGLYDETCDKKKAVVCEERESAEGEAGRLNLLYM